MSLTFGREGDQSPPLQWSFWLVIDLLALFLVSEAHPQASVRFCPSALAIYADDT